MFGLGLGLPELLVFSLIVLLLFGKRLPGLMRSLGEGIMEFKKGVRSGTEESPDRLN
jgi:sec-independent protein translocase protein TatA